MSKRNFTNKAKAILSEKTPQSLAEVLTGRKEEPAAITAAPVKPARAKAAKPSSGKAVKQAIQIAPKTTSKAAVKRAPKPREKKADVETNKPVSEVFRFTEELSERLRDYAYYERTTKTAAVEEALDLFLAQKGF